jgi:ribosome maturation factor RimP
MKSVDVEKLIALTEPVLTGQGYELVDLEWKNESGGWVLRFFIDKPGGVGLDDCADMSHLLSATLDVSDLIQPAYSLEVSSPGLDRPLRKESDFVRFVGKKAKIKTRRPIGESRRNFSGILLSAEAGIIRIDVGDQVCEVPVEAVEKANLVFDPRDLQGSLRKKDAESKSADEGR